MGGPAVAFTGPLTEAVDVVGVHGTVIIDNLGIIAAAAAAAGQKVLLTALQTIDVIASVEVTEVSIAFGSSNAVVAPALVVSGTLVALDLLVSIAITQYGDSLEKANQVSPPSGVIAVNTATSDYLAALRTQAQLQDQLSTIAISLNGGVLTTSQMLQIADAQQASTAAFASLASAEAALLNTSPIVFDY